jgi:glycosyltransferase involved in cell wall biosynthesis
VRRLVDRLHRQAPLDLIHAHFIYPEGVTAARLGRRYGIPVVTSEHANWVPWLEQHVAVRRQVLEALPHIERVTAVSRSTADAIRAVVADRVEVEILPNVVDERLFVAPEPRNRDPDRIFFAAVVRHVKGLDVLVHALAKVIRRRPLVYLEVAGDPYLPGYRRDERRLRKLVADLGLEARVRFIGPLASKDVARKMSESAVVALPSRRESFGSVLIESLACGTPVVATRCGGPDEIVDETVGRLVPVEDPEALAAGIVEVLERPQQFDPGRLREHALRRFGVAAVSKRLEALYADVLKSASGPRPPAP